MTVDIDFAGALLRGGGSALAVLALLLVARRGGRDLAGLLAGLPTVTGPALVWLAVDRGHDFAEQAAQGAVAAAVPCALFALVYACLAPRSGRGMALLGATVASASALPLMPQWQWPVHAMLPAIALTCVLCLALMPRRLPSRPSRSIGTIVAGAGPRDAARRAMFVTMLVSGLVSTGASLAAPAVGPVCAGLLTSPPLLAAAVVLELHRQGCPMRVQDFLRGYIAGLIGRSVFVAVFGALLVVAGLSVAVPAALAAALSTGGLTFLWMQRRGSARTLEPRVATPA